MKNIILFFGAGISKPSNYPLVSDIQKMLFEKNYTFENKKEYKVKEFIDLITIKDNKGIRKKAATK